MELIQKILDLPVIVQGALGSGLFWLVLELGQFLVRKIGEANTNTNMHNQTALKIALGSVLEVQPEGRRLMFQGMVHGALHYSLKAAIFLAMGLIVANVIPVVGAVGYIAALIFFFRALAYVPNFDRWKNPDEMQKTYSELQSRKKKASQETPLK